MNQMGKTSSNYMNRKNNIAKAFDTLASSEKNKIRLAKKTLAPTAEKCNRQGLIIC